MHAVDLIIKTVREHPGEVTIVAIGAQTYGEFRPKPGYRHTVEHALYIDAQDRGRSIGAALLGALIERANSAGVHVMIGGIDAENTASLRLHERFGFRQAGHLHQIGRTFDRWLDLVFVQLALN